MKEYFILDLIEKETVHVILENGQLDQFTTSNDSILFIEHLTT